MWISIGKSNDDKRWKNIQLEWPDIVERLRKPQKTSETLKQYHSLTKDERAKIKDIGGYVGGSIKGGRRKKENIECRTLITLEADEDCKGLWESFCLSYDCAALVHSTHSSTKENLRLRLVIPLSRECFTDEYEALIRKVADTLNIDYFDPTSFQAERLMYWPSTPKDAIYFFQEQKGKPLNVDEILKEYRDWKDVSQWPLHPKEKEKIISEKDRQENPLEKSGIIGAFCRTYNIHEAITKYLTAIYEATDVEGRYTFKQGSTAGGLVTYEDLFAYSHHATDPTSGKLCNAFDLVRLNLFSEHDKDIPANTPVSNLPSYLKVCELLTKDKKVKKALVSDKLKEAKNDFANVNPEELNLDKELNLDEEALSEEEWTSKLETDKKGKVIYSTVNNIVLILLNDKHLKDLLKWDSFNHRMILSRSTYWKKINNDVDKWVEDNDKANIRHYLEKMYGISGKDKINDAMLIVAYKNKFHPVREYLEALEWDGVDRLDTLFIDYLGAEDSHYTRIVTRITLVAAIARIFEPGCKFDTMLILVGKQGVGKSTLLNKLGGAWFSNNVGNLHTKESMEQLRGVWIMEVAELAAMKKAEVEVIKNFLSTPIDRYRQSYGETTSVFPRQCIFIGTTNEEEPLIDQTGNRRFPIIAVNVHKSTKNTFKIKEEEVKQIWAEALYYYQKEEPLYLDEETVKVAEKIQDLYTEKESYLPILQAYLKKKIPANWYELTNSDRFSFLQSGELDFNDEVELVERTKVSVLELWLEAIGGRKDMFEKHKAKSIRNAMKKIKGWECKLIKIEGITSRGWVKTGNF